MQLVGTLAPADITVNASRNYTFAGSGMLANGTLTKNGSGTLIVATNNTYTGATTISGGTLQVGAGGTSGNLGASNVVNNSSLVFNRSDAFTFSNVISGTGSLTQNGPSNGVLTLAAANTYTGPTTISAGTMDVTNYSALGDPAGNVTIASGATLDLGGLITTSPNGFNGKQFLIAGAGVGGNGAIYNSGANQTTAFQNIKLNGNATIGGLSSSVATPTGRIDMRPSAAVATPTLDLNGFTLTKSGNSQFSLAATNVTAGDIVVAASTGQPVRNMLSLEMTTSLPAVNKPDNSPSTVTMNDNTNLQLNQLTGNTITRPFVFNGDVLVSNGNAALSTFGAPIQLNAGSILRAATQAEATTPSA